MTKIINARVLTENGFENKDIYIENGKIKKIKSSDDYENIYQDFWEF